MFWRKKESISASSDNSDTPVPPEISWRMLVDFYGDHGKAQGMLCRAALLGDRPEVPWDWGEAIANYYTPARGLAWAIANSPQVFTNQEISDLIRISAGGFL